MVGVLVEASDALGRQPPSQREDEIVVREFSFDLAVRDRDLSVRRMNMRDFRFDEVHSSPQHGVAQIKHDVVDLTLAKCEPHERGVENEIVAAGNERDLVVVAQLLREPFGCYYAGESATHCPATTTNSTSATPISEASSTRPGRKYRR